MYLFWGLVAIIVTLVVCTRAITDKLDHLASRPKRPVTPAGTDLVFERICMIEDKIDQITFAVEEAGKRREKV